MCRVLSPWLDQPAIYRRNLDAVICATSRDAARQKTETSGICSYLHVLVDTEIARRFPFC